MQGLGVALKCGATKAHFDSCVGIHPSAAEEWVTMSNPARWVHYLPLCAFYFVSFRLFVWSGSRCPLARWGFFVDLSVPLPESFSSICVCLLLLRPVLLTFCSVAAAAAAVGSGRCSICRPCSPPCRRRVACKGQFAEPLGAEAAGYKGE